MSKSSKTKLPEIIRSFFCGDEMPTDAPEGYVYAGSLTEREASLIHWDSKEKGSEKFVQGLSEEFKTHHYYISVKEVIGFMLSSPMKKAQRREIEEYVKQEGLSINTQTRKKPHKKHEVKKVIPPKEKVTVSDVETTQEVIIDCPERLTLESLCGEKISLESGKHVFVLIDSPHKHESKEPRFRWLVLKDQLPKIFGKSVTNWHQLLGYDPLLVPIDNPPA